MAGLESQREQSAQAYKTRRKAVGIFDKREDFQKFLQRDDFIKKLSALSYLESVKKNQGKYVVHLYFRQNNRLTALRTTFTFGKFEIDDHTKRHQFDERNELSKYIWDFQQKNNIKEVIKKFVKPKILLKNAQAQTLLTESEDQRIEKSLQKRLDSFVSAEDTKSGLGAGSKRVKVQLPSDQKKLRDLCQAQNEEIMNLRQVSRHLINMIKNMQLFLPPNETQKVLEQLKKWQDLIESSSSSASCDSPSSSHEVEEDGFNFDRKNPFNDSDHASNISHFFVKENDYNNAVCGTSPVLMPASIVIGHLAAPTAMDTVMEEEKEVEEEEKNVQLKSAATPKKSRRKEKEELEFKLERGASAAATSEKGEDSVALRSPQMNDKKMREKKNKKKQKNPTKGENKANNQQLPRQEALDIATTIKKHMEKNKVTWENLLEDKKTHLKWRTVLKHHPALFTGEGFSNFI